VGRVLTSKSRWKGSDALRCSSLLRPVYIGNKDEFNTHWGQSQPYRKQSTLLPASTTVDFVTIVYWALVAEVRMTSSKCFILAGDSIHSLWTEIKSGKLASPSSPEKWASGTCTRASVSIQPVKKNYYSTNFQWFPSDTFWDQLIQKLKWSCVITNS